MDNAPNYVGSSVRYPKEIHFSKNSSNQRYTNHIMIFCLRLRIVCTILDTCGAYFVSGSSKTKLRYFLAYFQVSFLLFIITLDPFGQMNVQKEFTHNYLLYMTMKIGKNTKKCTSEMEKITYF